MSGTSSSRARTTSPPKRRGKNSPNNKTNISKQTGSNKSSNFNKQQQRHSSNVTGRDSQLSDLFTSLVTGAAATAAAKFTSGLGAGGKKEDKTPSGTAGEFDLYLFAQTWAPRFCCTNSEKCKQQDKDGVDDLTVHGLWPAYHQPKGKEERTYPAFCELGKDRKFSTKDKLAAHEFIKHGTCTNMSFDEYVGEGARVEEVDAMSGLRDFLNSKAGDLVSVADIFAEAGGNKMVAIQATQHCQLMELTTCWAKAPDGAVGEQVECPAHVLGSGRNSALLNKCTKLSLDASSDAMQCAFISKEMLKAMKAR